MHLIFDYSAHITFLDAVPSLANSLPFPQKYTSIPRRVLGSKGKDKVHPRTGHEGPEGKQMYSSTLPSTSAIDGWSALPPGRFTPRKDPVPIVQEAGWAPGSVWTDAENLALAPSPGFDPQTVQPIVSRYTD